FIAAISFHGNGRFRHAPMAGADPEDDDLYRIKRICAKRGTVMEEEIKASRRVDPEGEESPDTDMPNASEALGISELWNEELQRSYQILKAVMGTLPPQHRRELVGLLETLAEDGAGRKSPSTLESTAEQI